MDKARRVSCWQQRIKLRHDVTDELAQLPFPGVFYQNDRSDGAMDLKLELFNDPALSNRRSPAIAPTSSATRAGNFSRVRDEDRFSQ